MPLTPREQEALRRRCTLHVSGHAPEAPGAELARVAEWCHAQGWHADRYADGELIESFEAKVAALLGKPAAAFMVSGTMAQLIALRIWCERASHFRVAMHPTAHLELHEERAYARLHRLDSILLGPRDRPTLARDLAACHERPAALLIELPKNRELAQRAGKRERIGGFALDIDPNVHLDRLEIA